MLNSEIGRIMFILVKMDENLKKMPVNQSRTAKSIMYYYHYYRQLFYHCSKFRKIHRKTLVSESFFNKPPGEGLQLY